jgi:hypothetical protein
MNAAPSGVDRAEEVTATLLDILDGLDGQEQQVLQRTWAMLRTLFRAVGADLVVEAIDVLVHSRRVYGMDRVDELLEIPLDAAPLSKGPARRATFRSLDAVTTYLIADLRQIFLKIISRIHLAPSLSSEYRRFFCRFRVLLPLHEMHFLCRF